MPTGAEEAAGVGLHGEASLATWEIAAQEDRAALCSVASLPLAGLTIERQFERDFRFVSAFRPIRSPKARCPAAEALRSPELKHAAPGCLFLFPPSRAPVEPCGWHGGPLRVLRAVPARCAFARRFHSMLLRAGTVRQVGSSRPS
jgi:hypothetical protein